MYAHTKYEYSKYWAALICMYMYVNYYCKTYLQGLPPLELFMTREAVGTNFLYPTILEDLNLLKQHEVN